MNSGKDQARAEPHRTMRVAVVVLVTAIAAFAGCSSGDSDSFPVGTWAGPSADFPDSYTINEDTLVYESGFGDREAEVFLINTGTINGGDSDPGSNVTAEDTTCVGFAVIEYTAPASLAGSFNVFRWADDPSSPSRVYMAEWVGPSPDFAFGGFDNASEAILGATNAANPYFLGVYTGQ